MSTQEVVDAVEQTPESVTGEGESEAVARDAETAEELDGETPESANETPESADETPESADETPEPAASARGSEESPEDSVDGDRPAESREEDMEDSQDGTAVQRAEFESLSPKGASSRADNMHLLLDVAVPVTIQLGSTEMFLREILELGPGAVFKLERSVGEPVDILVNGEEVGRGEVVVVDDRFGVRVTELLSPEAHDQAQRGEG